MPHNPYKDSAESLSGKTLLYWRLRRVIAGHEPAPKEFSTVEKAIKLTTDILLTTSPTRALAVRNEELRDELINGGSRAKHRHTS